MYFDLQATATFVALFWMISGLFFICGYSIFRISRWIRGGRHGNSVKRQ